MTETHTGRGLLRSLGADWAYERFARALPSAWSRLFVAPPGLAAFAAAGFAVLLVAAGRDGAAAIALLAGTVLLGLQRVLRRGTGFDPGPRMLAAGFVTWVAETALGAATLLALGWSERADGATASLILPWVVGFAVVVQEYAGIVFARTLTSSGLGRPHDLGATDDGGRVLGLADPPPLLAQLARLHRSDVGWLVALYLLLDRPRPLLVAYAALAAGGLLWTSILRGWIVHRLEARTRRPAPPPPGLRGRERWRQLVEGMRAARDEAFWGLVFARPIVVGVLWLVGDVRWLTPNLVTTASMAVCIGAAVAAVVGGTAGTVVAIVLIAARSILDSLDGQLARYRGLSSTFGAFYDKVSDAVCWGALYLALALRAHEATGRAWTLLVPLTAAMVLYFQNTTYWLIRAIRPTVSTAGATAPLALRHWLGNFWRIVLFEEPDFYLWVALALATGEYTFFVALMAFAYGARALVANASRVATAHATWRGIAKEYTL